MPYDRRSQWWPLTTSLGLYQPLFTTDRRAAVMDSTPQPGPTTFDPMNLGIYPRFIVKGADLGGGAVLNTRLWNQAAATGEAVGDCRRCGHPMQAVPTHQAGRITWYEARCANGDCGAEIAAPNAEMLIRSSRLSEQPHSFSSGRHGKRS